MRELWQVELTGRAYMLSKQYQPVLGGLANVLVGAEIDRLMRTLADQGAYDTQVHASWEAHNGVALQFCMAGRNPVDALHRAMDWLEAAIHRQGGQIVGWESSSSQPAWSLELLGAEVTFVGADSVSQPTASEMV